MIRPSIGCLLLVSVVQAALADDWPQWRGPDRTGISREEGLLTTWSTPPRQLWLTKTLGVGYTAPSVAGGMIYVTGTLTNNNTHSDVLYAVNPKDGSIVWQCEYGPEWSAGSYGFARSEPTVFDGLIYIISGMGRMVCIDTKAGKTSWSVDILDRFKGKNIAWRIAESPLVVGKKVICHPGGPHAAVAALDMYTGATVWTTKDLSDASAYCSPALLTLNGRLQLVTHTENNVVGIDPETGSVLWTSPHHNKFAVHPNTPVAVGSDRVVVSSGYGYGTECLQVTAAGVKRVWQVQDADCHFHGMIVLGKRLYLTGSKGPLFCIDTDTGAVRSRTEGVGRAALIVAGGGLIAYSESKKAVQWLTLDGDTCHLDASLPIDFGTHEYWASPVLADGVLYVRHGEALAAYDLKAARASVDSKSP